MLFANTKSDIGNRYRKTSIGKYRDRIGSNMKISESDRELKNEIGTSLLLAVIVLIWFIALSHLTICLSVPLISLLSVLLSHLL